MPIQTWFNPDCNLEVGSTIDNFWDRAEKLKEGGRRTDSKFIRAVVNSKIEARVMKDRAARLMNFSGNV